MSTSLFDIAGAAFSQVCAAAQSYLPNLEVCLSHDLGGGNTELEILLRTNVPQIAIQVYSGLLPYIKQSNGRHVLLIQVQDSWDLLTPEELRPEVHPLTQYVKRMQTWVNFPKETHGG